ncbi:Zn(2)-C6 fungal-type domain-containing protein [Mycena chlorophos]|uniref:Zn(2)-C6 fungal-type domain-containing protein n=1 Tax=Mycena chlorophos TaxID=658473 RepID=A0A8H6WQ77_MYCCL|nr:Zn(2)-C6 fungal-type domain-containing protein [Mycena chlorophos]
MSGYRPSSAQSSSEDEDSGPRVKKPRRLGPACDLCRRRKIRCNATPNVPGSCSNCLDADSPCTFLKLTTKRTTSRSPQVASLQTRLESAEEKIAQLRAELAAVQSNKESTPHYTSMLDGSLQMLRTSLQTLIQPPAPPTQDDLGHVGLLERLQKMHIGMPKDLRFVGPSSGFQLVNAAFDLKEDAITRGVDAGVAPRLINRRVAYWTPDPWRYSSLRTQALTFPPMPLMQELIELFFTNVNVYLPILHRPTFEKAVSEVLFLRDDSFAAVVLLVCAVASRWHPDPQMGAPGGTGLGNDDAYGPGYVSPPPAYTTPAVPGPILATAVEMEGLECGWAWFAQVAPDAKHIFHKPTLFDLQYFPLAVQFMERSSSPHVAWNLIGAALRLMQDLGIHRRSSVVQTPTVESEGFKRVFWVLLYQDRMYSAGMGRSCMLQYEDFDIEPPIECDDEYWTHPTHPFQQPASLPSRITFFNKMMELTHILAASSKLIYSLSKAKKVYLGYGDRWEETVVAELNSALNTWRDSVPAHLIWDPQRADQVFFNQSAALQCAFTHVEIFIHRPFIPMMRTTPTTLPALAICTQAARACANIADVMREREGDVPIMFNFSAMLAATMILLLNLWTAKRAGNTAEVMRELPYIEKCKAAIKLAEGRRRAGALWDVLEELSAVGRAPQTRDSKSPAASTATPSSSASAPASASLDPSVFTPPQPCDEQYPAPVDIDIDMLFNIDPEIMTLWTHAPSAAIRLVDQVQLVMFADAKRMYVIFGNNLPRAYRDAGDASAENGFRCSICLELNVACGFQPAPKRSGTTNRVHNSVLETRLEEAERKIQQLRAELAAAQQANHSAPAYAPTLDGSLQMLRTSLHTLIQPQPPPTDEDLEHLELFSRMNTGTPIEKQKLGFVGQSAGLALVHAAFDLKADVSAREQLHALETGNNIPAPLLWTRRRPPYWTIEPWKQAPRRMHALHFPPLLLMNQLIDFYFVHVNMYLPLLHRPTFEKEVREGLFLQDDSFAATVLLVCAIGSRWHPDPLMGAPGGTGLGQDDIYGPGLVSPAAAPSATTTDLPPSADGTLAGDPTWNDEAPGLSCGWAWFAQVSPDLKQSVFLDKPRLYDLQYYALAAQFLQGAESPHIAWNIIGTALRLAQDMGIHRRSARDSQPPNAKREKYKRVFWVLLYHDRILSCGLGRPCTLHYEECVYFDAELPIECDDEYWDHPTRPFRQPAGIPSRISFFNRLVELNNILAASLKLVYSLSKSRNVLLGYGDRWEETVVAELDSALNTWRDRVPEHLRWDPKRSVDVFFDQSAALYCSFHHVELFIHRPFIPVIRKTPTALPALAICTQAARACANIVDIQRLRKGNVPVVFNFYPMFSAAVILLINIWIAKRAGRTAEVARELEYVYKFVRVIKVVDGRWKRTGMLLDVMLELASIEQPMSRSSCDGPSPTESAAASDIHNIPSLRNWFEQPFSPSSDQDAFGSLSFSSTSDGGSAMSLEMDAQMMAMWANAPGGLETDKWDQFIIGLNGQPKFGPTEYGTDWN